MSDEYGNDYITITDEDGKEIELEHLDTAELGDEVYMAFLPTDIDENDDDFGMIILKVSVEGDEEFLITIDDEEELETAFGVFMQRISEESEDSEESEESIESDDEES